MRLEWETAERVLVHTQIFRQLHLAFFGTVCYNRLTVRGDGIRACAFQKTERETHMQYSYTPHGVCSRAILIDAEDGIVNKVQFIGGCSGNTQGIAALVEGMPLDEVVKRLEGIKCGSRPTSCPDQLAKALKKVAEEQ